MRNFDNYVNWIYRGEENVPSLLHRMRLFATPSVTPDAGGGAPPPSGAAPPAAPAPGSAAPPAGSPPATGAPAVASPTTGAPDPNAPNIAVLRQSHELVSELTRAGLTPDQVKTYVTQHNALRTEASELAEELGYTPESLEAALKTDFTDTLQYLRSQAVEARRTAPPPDPRDIVRRELAPVNNYIRQQQAREWNQRIDGQYDSMVKAHDLFKGKTVDPDLQQGLKDWFTETIKYDDKALTDYLTKGDASGVQSHFDKVLASASKFINAWTKQFSGPVVPGGQGGQPPVAGAPPAGKGPKTLQDIIDGVESADSMPSMRGFK